jgi:DNA-binding MarR family transcriptional regulator
MQATAAEEQVSAQALAEDLFALLVFVLKSSGQDMFRAMGELELSVTQWKLLHVLDGADDDHSLKALGEHLGLSLPAMSRAVDGLHQRELVERQEDEHDRRMKRVRIAEPGRELVRRLAQTRLQFLEQFSATLSEPQRRRLAGALAPALARAEVRSCRPEAGA